jgi:hypothetical protein
MVLPSGTAMGYGCAVSAVGDAVPGDAASARVQDDLHLTLRGADWVGGVGHRTDYAVLAGRTAGDGQPMRRVRWTGAISIENGLVMPPVVPAVSVVTGIGPGTMKPRRVCAKNV